MSKVPPLLHTLVVVEGEQSSTGSSKLQGIEYWPDKKAKLDEVWVQDPLAGGCLVPTRKVTNQWCSQRMKSHGVQEKDPSTVSLVPKVTMQRKP